MAKQKKLAVEDDAVETLQLKKRAFLAAYAQTGNITKAAEIAGIARQTHYEWLADDTYAKAFVNADDEAGDRLEIEARRRAVDGVDEPVYQKGELVGTVRKYSDTLLIYLLNGAKPEKYKQRVHNEVSGKMALDVDIERMDDDEILGGIADAIQAINALSSRIGTPIEGGGD